MIYRTTTTVTTRGTAYSTTQSALYIGKSDVSGYNVTNFCLDELHIWEFDASVGEIKFLYGLFWEINIVGGWSEDKRLATSLFIFE